MKPNTKRNNKILKLRDEKHYSFPQIAKAMQLALSTVFEIYYRDKAKKGFDYPASLAKKYKHLQKT